MKSSKRVVVTGIGPLTSMGIGKNDLWHNLRKEKPVVTRQTIKLDKEEWGTFHYHKVKNFNIHKYGISQEALEWIKDWKEGDETIDLFYLIASIQLALCDAALPSRSSLKHPFGLVVSHENINLLPFLSKITAKAYELFRNNKKSLTKKQFYDILYHDCLKSGYDTQPFMTLFHVAKVFNVHQFSLFICNACASGVYAIETGAQMIKNGQNSVVVVSAADKTDIYKYLWFKDLGIYSPDGIMRPFAENSNGIVFGDGGIGLVLEDLEHARKRNAFIYAEYLGGGFSLESWQVTVPKIGSDSYQTAILNALARSNVTTKEVDLVCPHGVGSRVIDYYESKALTDIFGKNFQKPFLTAFKPYIGHNLGGSALMETAILLMCLNKNTILPTLNTGTERKDFNLSVVKKELKQHLNTVLKVSCAFAGFNAAAIFRKIEN